MKHILVGLMCLIVGCTLNAKETIQPSNELVLASFFDAAETRLSEEPLCDMVSVSMDKKDLRLKDHLATVLSSTFDKENITTISTSCSESKHELPTKKIIGIWDCMMLISEKGKNGEFISSSTIAFGLNKMNLKYVPGSLRCF